MDIDLIKENIQNIEDNKNGRANQLLHEDPVAREWIGMRKGLELALSEEEASNGEIPNGIDKELPEASS